MGVFITPPVNIVVSAAVAYTAADALGSKNSVRVPENGVIQTVVVQDRDSENGDFDIVFFKADIAGTADNAAFAPSDAELATVLGSVTVTGYKAFNTNSIATVANVGLGYWAPTGVLFFQCVTRGTQNFTATSDIQISFAIVY